ncbi:ATP-binding protein [Nocardioides marmoraquaticus]
MGDLALVARRLVVWVPLYLLAGVAGRLTIIDGGAMSLVWPAAGIAMLWLASATRRTVVVDVVVLAACIFGVNSVTGAPPSLATVFMVSALVQVAVVVALVRRLRPGLFLFGGTDPVSSLRDLGCFVAAAVTGAAVGAVLGVLGLLVVGTVPVSPASLVVWWGRNSAGTVVLGLLGLLLLHRAAVVTGGVPAPRAPVVRRSWWEVALLWAVTGALLGLVFGRADVLPVSFLLLFTTVLVAVRLGPLAVTTHALALGAGAMVFTIAGRGPFAGVADLPERALVAQLFVVMTVVTGLVLTFSRIERDEATAGLAELQRETAERARLFGTVLEHLQEGLNVITADGRVLVTNPAGERLLGRDVDAELDPETLGRAYGLSALDGQPLAAQDVPYVRAVAGESFTQDYLLSRPGDPETRVLEVTGGPLPDTEVGEVRQAVITYRDVTALRHDRDALATFAGVVAHDLKRPLTVITGWTDALAEDLADGTLDREAGLGMLQRVTASAEQMRSLLDDLLYYTVVRDAKVRLEPVDVSAVAEAAAEVLRAGESAPRIAVEPGLAARADPVLLRQVLDNLLGNAVKYVGPGVRPRVVVDGRVEDGCLVLGVADNGIGVPEAQRERVFDTFHRAHGEAYRGTGLGLAIVRRAVERCGGSVRLEGAPGGGSRFEVRLPAVG